MHEHFIDGPSLYVFDTRLILFPGNVLNLHLLLKIVNGICKLQVISNVRHFIITILK